LTILSQNGTFTMWLIYFKECPCEPYILQHDDVYDDVDASRLRWAFLEKLRHSFKSQIKNPRILVFKAL